MSESDHHRTLVKALTHEISCDPVWAKPPIVYCDIQDGFTKDFPPILGSNRPDVFVRDIETSFSIIGEAKTANDIDNLHTYGQLESFFNYLCGQPHGEFWMGVPWDFAGTAMRVCKHMREKSDALHIPICVVGFMVGNIVLRRRWRD